MAKTFLIAILLAFSTMADADRSKDFFSHGTEYDVGKMESHLNIPFPLKLTSTQIISRETRRLIHFLKRVFVGVSANYSTGRSYSNYGPVIGIQFPTRIGLRLWGGMSQGRTMDLKKDYVMDAKVSGINGKRIGVGIKLREELSLDLEYQTIDGEQSVQNNSYIMSLSVPFSL